MDNQGGLLLDACILKVCQLMFNLFFKLFQIRYVGGHPALPEPPPAHGRATEPTPGQRRRIRPTMPGYPTTIPQTPIGVPGYPGRPPVNPVVTRDPLVVWDPADRQR